MAIGIISRPSTVNGVLKSTFTAVRNPVLYRMQRRDYTISSTINNAGFLELRFNGIDLTAYFQIGNTVQVLDNTQAVSGVVTASGFGVNTSVILTTPFASGSFAVYANNLSKRTDWKMQVEVFNGITNVSLTEGLIKFDYYADTSGNILVDISEILKAFVSAEWIKPVAANEEDAAGYISFYIKYNEYYDGVAQAVTNDSANVFRAVNAAMQVYYNETQYAHGGNLLGWIPLDTSTNWMTRKRVSAAKDRVKMWRGWPFTLSFLWDSSFAALQMTYGQYNQAGALIGSAGVSTLNAANINKLNRLDPMLVLGGALDALCRKLRIQLNRFVGNFSAGGGPVVGFVTVDLNLGVVLPAGTYIFSGAASLNSLAAFTGSATQINVYARNSTTLADSVFATQNGTDAGPTNLNFFSVTVVVPIAFDQIRLTFQRASAANYTYSYAGVGVYAPATVALDINIEEPCDNGVMLEWKNSAGGDEWHMFQASQELGWSYDNGRKSKRMILSAEQITYVEWEAINELNDPSDISGVGFSELSSAVNKTAARAAQQVYIVAVDGTKTGVVVIPKQARTETRRTLHNIEIEIELPQVL
jgi:hypothetical protein